MPRYTIALPDGRTMEAEAGTEADALAGAQAWYAANPKASPAAGSRAAAVDQRPPSEPSELERLYPSGSQAFLPPDQDPSLEGTVREVAQGATGNWADEIAATAGRGGNMAMRGLGMDVPEKSRADILKDIRTDAAGYREKNPNLATAANIAGAVAPGAGAAVGLGRALGLNPGTFWGATGLSGGSGAALGAVDAVGRAEGAMSPGEVAKTAGAGALEGGGWGAAFGGAGNAIGRVAGPWATDAAQRLTDRGIRLTPGQTLGGLPQRFEDAAGDIPFVGQMARNRREEGMADFNRVALNDALEPMQGHHPTPRFTENDEVGRELIAEAHDAVSAAYRNVVPLMAGDLNDAQLLVRVQNAAYQLPQRERNAFVEQVLHYIGRAEHASGGAGPVPGEAMQDIITAVRDQAARNRLSNDPGTFSREMAEAYEMVQEALEDNLTRYTPPDVVEAYRAANRAFANMLPIERAAGSLGAEEGVFNPAQLLSGVKATDRSKRKTSFALGRRGPMQDLSEDGKDVFGPKVRNSGTPERMFMQNLPWAVAAGTYLNPMVATLVPLALGSQTRVAHRVFQRAATMSPATRMALRRAMERVTPTAGATLGSQMGAE
jgi:hypothetical protein